MDLNRVVKVLLSITPSCKNTVVSLQHRLLADLIISNSATLTSNGILFSRVCNLSSKDTERNMQFDVNKIGEFGPSSKNILQTAVTGDSLSCLKIPKQ